MAKDEKQDERLNAIEVEMAKIKERQAAKVSREECAEAKGDYKITIIKAVNHVKDELTAKMEADKREIIDKLENISPMTLRQKAAMIGGGSAGGIGLGGIILLMIKYWPWGK